MDTRIILIKSDSRPHFESFLSHFWVSWGHSGVGPRESLLSHFWVTLIRHAQYDWTTGVPDDGNYWRKFRAVPRSYPLHSLVCTMFNKGGNRRAFRLPGVGGDHFHCKVEPSPGHFRCRNSFDLSGLIRANRKFEWFVRIGLTRYKNRAFNCEWFARIDSRESRCESPVPLRFFRFFCRVRSTSTSQR